VVNLPGEVKANAQATLYAKVSGYLKEIRVDKGDHVKAGQLLATLESPDAQQQVAAARVELENRQQLARRAHTLSDTGVMSRQEEENATAAEKVSNAGLTRARALESYTEIRAPFAGVVTTRYVDPGALLPAATGSTQSAQPVVDIADIGTLRVYVYLGQDDAALVKVGDKATVSLDALPGEPITAQVSRVSRNLDPRTRTMLTEVDIDNASERLYPGEFVHVAVTLHGPSRPLIPSEALISRGDKLFVAVIAAGKAHLTPITAGGDDGKAVQVITGLHGGEQVALSAAGELTEGASVQVVPSPPPAK
jgi:RND family efflux transporter MFP subunit